MKLTCPLQTVIAIQNAIPESQISVGMSLVAFAQTFGGALFLSFAQTDFNSSLKQALRKFAPEVSSEAVAAAGATDFRHLIPKDSVQGVIEAYSESVSNVFYIAAGCAVACFVLSWGIGWKSVKKPKTVAPEA